MKIHNNTQLSIEEIGRLPVLGKTVSKWRQRNITLRQHPTKEDYVISVGVTFDGTMMVISEEPKCAWTVALEYASRGKEYVSE